MAKSKSLTIQTDYGNLGAILIDSPKANSLFVFAHGAGAGMTHDFMTALAEDLLAAGVATLRFNFPYMEQGSRRPDHRSKLIPVVRAAVSKGVELAGERPVFAGGKSMGGRMTSQAEAEKPLGVAGLVFVGFPLHPAKKIGVERADHLNQIKVPMLFLQGTRDALADLKLIKDVSQNLGRRAQLHVVEGADHGFNVLKRSGRTKDEVMAELTTMIQRFTDRTEPTTRS